jgi:hypothetical protein
MLVVTLLAALGIATLWEPEVLQETPFAFFLCLVPVFVIMGSFWQGWPVEKHEQPARGILLLLLAALFAVLIFMWTRVFIGGNALNPITNTFGITAVTLFVIMTPLFKLWPFAGKLPTAFAGIAWLISLYVIGFILFRTLYNFAPLNTEPWYNPAIDPSGRFAAEIPLTVLIMGLPFSYAWLHLEMWPLSRLKQPWLGLTSCTAVWVLGEIMYLIATQVLGFGVIEAQVKFGVFAVFGMIIWLMLFESWPGRKLPQPAGGLLKIVPAILLSIGMFYLVRGFGLWLFPGSEALQGDGLYRWMATVALGLCFPVFALYTGLFQSWPLPVRTGSVSSTDERKTR